MKEFTWNEETIDYFKELYAINDSNGWAHHITESFSFCVSTTVKYKTMRLIKTCNGDLINKIEDKVNKEEYEWLEAKLQEKELD